MIELSRGTTESHTGTQSADAGAKMAFSWNSDAILDHKVIGSDQFLGYDRPVVDIGTIESTSHAIAARNVNRIDEGARIATFLMVAATRATLTH